MVPFAKSRDASNIISFQHSKCEEVKLNKIRLQIDAIEISMLCPAPNEFGVQFE